MFESSCRYKPTVSCRCRHLSCLSNGLTISPTIPSMSLPYKVLLAELIAPINSEIASGKWQLGELTNELRAKMKSMMPRRIVFLHVPMTLICQIFRRFMKPEWVIETPAGIEKLGFVETSNVVMVVPTRKPFGKHLAVDLVLVTNICHFPNLFQ